MQSYSEVTDTLTLRYVSEPNESYEEELAPLLQQKKIKLMLSPI